jgi:hypothetical protein
MTAIRRALLKRFLEHLHDTGALSCPPSDTWIDAFNRKETP